MTTFRLAPRLLLATGAALAFAGCGGTNGNTDSARIRAVDVATNAANANILINGASANGDQVAFTSSAVSPYLYLSGNRTSSFSFTTTAAVPIGAAPPAGPVLTLNNNQYYTVFLLGRSDVPVRNTTTVATNDPRFLQVVAADDSHAAPAPGKASVRIVDAAPDAGTVNVQVNGATLSADYANLTYQTPTKTFLPAPYIDVSAGTVSVLVNKTGTATALFPATTVSLAAGKSYTLVITEPTIAPTFGLQTIAD